MLDFPDRTACILCFAGCNMRCQYCYNPAIVLGKGKKSFSDALAFLASRKGLLDGVVLSGGECSSHRGLPNFIREIKEMGMLVKMDTNGSNPEKLRFLLDYKMLDYVALDFKAPKEKFQTITQSNLYSSFEESLELLIQSNLLFEVRTTVHSALLNEADIAQMATYLSSKNYRGNYYIQYFKENVPTMNSLGSSAKLRLKNRIFAENISLVER
jgi:pyruvate formate lyase activating enzyme